MSHDTTTSAELANCPFCGGAARHLPFHCGFNDEKAICDKCEFSLSPAAWNRRAAMQPAEADPNAPWLTLAHMICADAGIPVGHIMGRLKVLREVIENSAAAWHADLSQLDAVLAKYPPELKELRERQVAYGAECMELGKIMAKEGGK